MKCRYLNSTVFTRVMRWERGKLSEDYEMNACIHFFMQGYATDYNWGLYVPTEVCDFVGVNNMILEP